MTDLLHTVELNDAHIDIYKNSVIFHDDKAEESWELDWVELYKLTEGGWR